TSRSTAAKVGSLPISMFLKHKHSSGAPKQNCPQLSFSGQSWFTRWALFVANLLQDSLRRPLRSSRPTNRRGRSWCPVIYWSAGRTLLRPSGKWPPPTPRSASLKPPFTHVCASTAWVGFSQSTLPLGSIGPAASGLLALHCTCPFLPVVSTVPN